MQRLQLQVFIQLMAYRAELASPRAREAVNAVDVLFAGDPDVRSARQLFMAAVNKPGTEADLIVERYHNLIESVARTMGVAALIGPMDIRQGYYPEAAGKLDLASLMEAEEKIARKAAKKAGEPGGPAAVQQAKSASDQYKR